MSDESALIESPHDEGPNNLCFVCSNRVSVSSRNSCDLFKEKTSLNETPPSYILSSILNRRIDASTSHSSSICRKCFKLCCEFEDVEHRLLEIRLELIRQYNKTAEKFSLRPIELEDDEIDISFDDDDVDDQITLEIVKPAEKHPTDSNTTDQLAESQELIILQAGDPMIDEEYREENVNDLVEEATVDEGEVSLPTIQMSLQMKEEYFQEENMVEIIADDEGESYEHLIVQQDNDGQISIEDEGSLDSTCIQIFGAASDSENNDQSHGDKRK